MPIPYTDEMLMRDRHLLADIEAEPMTPNVVWAEKYNISRERVRQIRAYYGLPTTEEAKEAFIVKNFNQIVEQVLNGKNFKHSTDTVHENVGFRSFNKVMFKYPQLNDLYDNARATFEYKRANPKNKKCTTCKTVKPIDNFYFQSRGTYDKRAVRCSDCVKDAVNHYYEIRKQNFDGTTVEAKACTQVPELGLLPADHFHKMSSANTGLQMHCKAFQTFYAKFRNSGLSVEDSNAKAKAATLRYYKINYGMEPIKNT